MSINQPIPFGVRPDKVIYGGPEGLRVSISRVGDKKWLSLKKGGEECGFFDHRRMKKLLDEIKRMDLSTRQQKFVWNCFHANFRVLISRKE